MIKLQVKIILWIYIISAAFLCDAQIENINSNELLAFEDFLRVQHLRHAVLVSGEGPELKWNPNCSKNAENYKRLLTSYSMQFFTPNMGVNFENLFYYGAPRTAVFVGEFESAAIGRWAYQPASDVDLFNNSQAWFMLGSSQANEQDEDIIKQRLSPYRININADITVALRGNNSVLILYDVYRVGQQAALSVEPKGIWSISGGYQLMARHRLSWLQRRKNLANISLIGSTVLTEKPIGLDDFAYLTNDKQFLQLDSMQRKTYQLFTLIRHMYNLSLDVRFTRDWGQLQPDGKWSDLMGQITSGEAHFSLCPLRFVLDRQRYIQYSPVLHTQFLHFLFRHPRRSSIRNIFFEPLSTQVWSCVLALVVCSSFLLLLHISHEHRLQESEQPVRALERPLAVVWFTMMETFLQQGPTMELFRLTSTRMLISACCLFSFLLMQFYGAFIVGSLLSESPRSIVNLQVLFESGLEIGMENTTYNFALFANTTNQLVRDVYTQRICSAHQHNIMSIDQGLQRIKQGGFAFHALIDRMYRVLIEIMEEHQFCELQEIMFNPPYVSASVLPKGSPWREHLAHALIYLRETGLMQYNDKIWSVPKPDCRLFQGDQVDVDLNHFAPALFALVLAMMASATVFLLELLLNWLKVAGKSKINNVLK